MKPTDWQRLARRRILSILRVRRVASLRQLESKISEAGPDHMRAEPHHVSPALDTLVAEGKVTTAASVGIPNQTPTPLYAHPTYDPKNPDDLHRLDRVQAAYQTYLQTALSPKGGLPLEQVVQASIEASTTLHWVGRPGNISQASEINGRNFVDHGKLDHILIDKQSSLLIGAEDKNYREWIYPHSPLIRALLKKCVLYDISPLFITRRLPYISRRVVFPAIGILCFQTFHQFFSPKDQPALTDARHKDGLGFHDIRWTTDPLPTLVHWFRNTLPTDLPQFHGTFQANKDIIAEYAVKETLDYDEFIRELEVFYPKDYEEPEYYGEY